MDENKVNHNRDILLVRSKRSGNLQAVTGMGGDGKIKTVKPSTKNDNFFLTVDKSSNNLEKFFKDFMAQAKDPASTEFYKMGLSGTEVLQNVINLHPNAPLVAESRVHPEDYLGQKQEQDPKVILTQGEDGKLKAIAEDADGKLKTVDPTKENADGFLKIDTRGNALENFFKKFTEQFKAPSHTGLYAVSAKAVDKVAAFFDKIIKVNPEDKALTPYKLTPEGKLPEPGQGKYQPLDLNKLDWKEVEKYGLTGDKLQDALKAMIYGHKSPGLLTINMEINGKMYETQARLSLQPQPDGSIKIDPHPKQEKVDFEKPFMGILFDADAQKQLTTTGNGGRVFDLQPVPGGETVPSLVSLDRLTNRFEAVPVVAILIPQTLKNAPLSQEQQDGLKTGKGVLVENMDKRVRSGEEPGKITRIVQYNAVNKNFDFLFTPEQRQKHQQERAANKEQKPAKEQKEKKGQYVGKVFVPKVVLGVTLSEKQFNNLLAGKATKVEGMTTPSPKPKPGEQKVEATDAKGEKFNAWVKPSQESGKLKYYKWNPDKSQKQGADVKPAAGYETQHAVNSQGKTNEATKHSTDPLKPGQAQPTEKQAAKKEEKQQEQRQSPAKPKKSTGHKM